MLGTNRRSRRAAERGCGLAVLVLAALACIPAAAQASGGEYDVEICTPRGDAAHLGLEFHEDAASTRFFAVLCQSIEGERAIAITAQSGLVSGGAEWIVGAPAGTLIRSVQGNRQVRLVGNGLSGQVMWDAFDADPNAPLFELFATTAHPPDGPVAWTPATPTSSISGRLLCFSLQGCSNVGGEEQVRFTDVVAHVLDQSAPTIATAGSLLAGGPVAGTRVLGFEASDLGGGVARVSLLVDGQPTETKADPNGGLCVSPFHAMAPCGPELDSEFSLDTRTLADGAHEVEAVVEDASGLTASSSAAVDVHNRPTNSGRPALSGAARIGQVLTANTGQWDGGPTSFAYRWLRCPAGAAVGQEASCAPLPGAGEDRYEVTAADAGGRLVAKVTATNPFGSEAAFSAPSEPVAGPGDPGSPSPPRTAGAPETRIVKHPRRRTSRRTASFAFSADQPGSSFQCKLDRGAFKPCRSPFRRKLKPGRHSFRVRAVSSAGAVDPTPASFRWKIQQRSSGLLRVV
jgi:hypothetical protein